jgi:hypothetical protein
MQLSFKCVLFLASVAGWAADSQLERGKLGIAKRAGCYLVDYSFVETDAVKEGYVRDNRVYDVNKNKSVKEWIFVDEVTPTRYKLQHVLLGVDLEGKPMKGSILKHTGEDWEYNAKFLYDYAGNSTWKVKPVAEGTWTRRVTSLDDGLRYQCAAPWDLKNAYPEWTCSDYAPIPGRETRDMKRNDYQALERTSRLLVYGDSWLEREANTKVIQQDETRTPLVKELGKIWYVRLPDAECQEAIEFVKPRREFWDVVRSAWDRLMTGEATVVEKGDAGSFARYSETMKIEKEYLEKDLKDAKVRKEAEDKLVALFMKSRK